ncbi:tetratricopeptide repeat protein [Fictibacillus barbaricus]|uniref:Tetratricopeptide (TPR) repeat protein n=1 Tax=Fictibacillus barbaricus TaxID=182136 RepID=A0ABU1U0Q5_9BACL|nr:tetratricopeptide repeat protein [Fictibacillus barbaricus]MDR7073040.1 tetratricopeptide (TPR) repeat protein [Fictibacillus barbaricus]
MQKRQSASQLSGRVLPFIQDGDYFFEKGIKAYNRRDLYKAKKMFERAVTFQPEEPSFLCQLASTLAEIGEYEESNRHLLSALEQSGSDMMSECHFFLANNFAHLGMYSDAEEHALLYMHNDPEGEFLDDTQELLDLINLETGSKSQDMPMTEEEELIKAHDEARQLIERGDLPAAQDQLREIIVNHPKFWAAYNNLALTHFYKSEFDEAISVLEDVLVKNPGNLNALCNLAIFLYHLGMDEQGGKLVDRLKSVHPIHAEHRYKLGNTFGLLEEHVHANKWLQSLKKSSFVFDPVTTHMLAVSYYALGNKELAVKTWKKVLDLDPEGSIAPYYMEKALKDVLTVAGGDYQYRIPLNKHNKPKKDRQIKAMKHIQHVRKGLEKNKITHLFLLRGNKNEEAYATLSEFCLRTEETLFIKEIAANIMLEHRPEQPVKLVHEESVVEVGSTSAILTKALDVLQVIKDHGAIIDEQVLFYWSEAIKFSEQTGEKIFENVQAIAGAIDYLSRKQKVKTTQRSAAELYGISVSVISLRIKKLIGWVNRGV